MNATEWLIVIAVAIVATLAANGLTMLIMGGMTK